MSTERFVTRRDLVAIGVGAFVVGVVPLASRRRPEIVRRTMPIMGTVAELVVVGMRSDRAEPAIDAALAELTQVERTMSRFRPDSDIGRVNAGAADREVPVGAATALVVREALDWASETRGAFDPAIGRVVELWDVTHRSAPPASGAIQRLAGRSLHQHVHVGQSAGTPVIALTHPDVHLDLGGIAKGYAVDRAAAALRAHGVTRALVNVGGDLVAIGTNGDDAPWQVGIRDPEDARRLLMTVAASDCAIATSGDYEQFFRYRGHRYHHLMDPRTAAPAAGPLRSATVRAARCLDADAGATAAFNLTPGEARDALARRGAELLAIA